jgi:bacteriorhodopsin
MAQLDVQPKKANPWWLWLLLAVIAIIILFFVVRGCNSGDTNALTMDANVVVKQINRTLT